MKITLRLPAICALLCGCGSDLVVHGASGATVRVPAGAAAPGLAIAVAVADSSAPPLPPQLVPLGADFAFLPHGAQFSSPVTITVPFEKSSPAPRLYTALPGGAWQRVTDARVSGAAMQALVTHFSFFRVVEERAENLDAGPADAGSDAGCAGLVCDGRCFDSRNDPGNCGACGNTCAGGEICASGVCRCRAGEQICGISCTSLANDTRNCGGCGSVCDGGSCVDGGCVAGCDGIVCGAICVHTIDDPANCGGCGIACNGAAICVDGGCVGGGDAGADAGTDAGTDGGNTGYDAGAPNDGGIATACGGTVPLSSNSAWSSANCGLWGATVLSLVQSPDGRGPLYANVEGSGIWSSPDFGGSWAPLGSDPYVSLSAVASDGTLYGIESQRGRSGR